MDALIKAVETTPIIDHHAHNLLLPSAVDGYDFMAVTSEAAGPALKFASSTLSHLRARRQLSELLECESTWEAVEGALKARRKDSDIAWARRCFQGIETVLIDDGLDSSTVHPYNWHDQLTRSKCKRIVRIEKVAETIMTDLLEQSREMAPEKRVKTQAHFIRSFTAAIEEAISDPEVAGFKSVICYRVGLKIPAFDDGAEVGPFSIEDLERFSRRLEDEHLNPYLVHLTAKMIESSGSPQKKPIQFHTGLGDNDIDLELSNPSHLQAFIETYPEVPIVLLHAAYPFTREAGYLASVYENCWLDIGEVFPMVSEDGQMRVIEMALELCPSEKLTWSTDGHWFAETYLLAVIQIREAMLKVLDTYVERGSLTITEAIKVVRDVFFDTANRLYNLNLPLVPVGPIVVSDMSSSKGSWTNNFAELQRFVEHEPSVQFLRLQWLDYTNTLRLRIVPIKQALRMFSEGRLIGIVEAVFGLLQTDFICPGFSATNEYKMYPQFASLRLGSRKGYATVQCEFQRKDGKELPICPRTSLRKQVEKAGYHGVEFLVGFEVEIVFMSIESENGEFQYGFSPVSEGHCWSSARALHSDSLMAVIENIFEKLERAGLILEQFHPESSAGQFEFPLGPLPPVLAVDALIAAKEIIQSTAANAGMRATVIPKPDPQAVGTGAHTHISLTPAHHWEMFYAGFLKHIKAIAAFSYSNDASYERVADGVWAGSTWISWGTQNRETSLRRIEGSHFEIRCVDGLSNPYLVLAAIIGAGMQGILDKEPLKMKDCPQDPSKLTAKEREEFGITSQFPKSISEALSYLEADQQLRNILSDPLVETYLAVKRAEREMLQKMEPAKRRNWLIERY